MISEFKGEFAFLSNFYLCEFIWNGFLWKHSEGAYQAAKSLDVGDWNVMQHLSPGQSKQKGRRLKIRSDWESVKDSIMAQVLDAKFTQNPELMDKLIKTYPKSLEEGNGWGDTYWGVCPPRSNNGRNTLGQLLMALRDYHVQK